MAYIAMDCVHHELGEERSILITVVEYESNDPLVLTGAESFNNAADFIAYLKEANQRGFTEMFTEDDSFKNFTRDELLQMEPLLVFRKY